MPYRVGVFLALLAAPFIHAAEPFLIENVRVFDGVRMLPPTNVRIEDGRIRAIGRAVKAGPGVRTIDASGKSLLPGLIDAHMHAVSRDGLRSALSFGVTTCLDMFTSPQMSSALRAEQSTATGIELADLRSAGVLVTAPGGHGTEYGLAIPTLSGPEEAQAFIDARIADGSDYIKLVKDDGSAFGFRRPTLNQVTLSAAVRAAHFRHRLAIVHIATTTDARAALAAAADGLAHVYTGGPDSAIARAAAHQHVFWTPTLSITAMGCPQLTGARLQDDPYLGPYLGEQARRNLMPPAGQTADSGRCRSMFEAVRQMRAAGVAIQAGTDAPNPGTADGASLHMEMALLVAAGLTPVEALAAATSGPASAYGLSDRGRIAPGMRADLVMVEGDPSHDIRATRRIVAIWKLGTPVSRIPAFR